MLVRPEGRTLPVEGLISSMRTLPVSMLVRPEGRTLLRGLMTFDRTCAHPLRVSMLVRPEGRTLLQHRDRRSAGHPPRVSMLVRPEGRTLRELRIKRIWFLLVSMLVRPEGRTLRDQRAHVTNPAVPTRFNARPPRRTDATPSASAKIQDRLVFQCSSAPKDGRYMRTYCTLARRDVSMLVRPEGRTLRGSFSKTTAPKKCGSFNARPPRRTDATSRL